MSDATSRPTLVTGAQLRGARGLLNMSVADLAERTGLALNTIRKAEMTNGATQVTAANARLLLTTLEEAGVVFIPADEMGVGVRLRELVQLPLARRRKKNASDAPRPAGIADEHR